MRRVKRSMRKTKNEQRLKCFSLNLTHRRLLQKLYINGQAESNSELWRSEAWKFGRARFGAPPEFYKELPYILLPDFWKHFTERYGSVDSLDPPREPDWQLTVEASRGIVHVGTARDDSTIAWEVAGLQTTFGMTSEMANRELAAFKQQ